MGLLRTIILFVLFYYLFKFLLRVVLPLVGIHLLKKQAGYAEKARGQAQRQEGEVRVENKRPNKSNIAKDEGEYVDFEEVD